MAFFAVFAAIFLNISFNAQANEYKKTTIETFDHHYLNAELVSPSASEENTIVLIIQGSGNVDLDGDVSSPFVGSTAEKKQAKLSLQIAEALATQNITSLRFSKRGVDDPTLAQQQNFPYLTKDAHSALEWIRKNFPNRKISILGFSEGAMIALQLAYDEALKPASENKLIDSLHLLNPPTRNIKEIIEFQFVNWPVQMLEKNIDLNQDGLLDRTEHKGTLELHSIGDSLSKINVIDLDGRFDGKKDGLISIENEVKPEYEKAYSTIQKLLETPALKNWYEAMLEIPSIETIAQTLSLPITFYISANDSQANTEWMLQDTLLFDAEQTDLFLYPEVGHCFSPYSGEFHNIKTSGPLSEDLLQDLANNLR